MYTKKEKEIINYRQKFYPIQINRKFHYFQNFLPTFNEYLVTESQLTISSKLGLDCSINYSKMQFYIFLTESIKIFLCYENTNPKFIDKIWLKTIKFLSLITKHDQFNIFLNLFLYLYNIDKSLILNSPFNLSNLISNWSVSQHDIIIAHNNLITIEEKKLLNTTIKSNISCEKNPKSL